ncbi:MAG: alpha/beta hydrolase [Pigmentiphaga sp.]|uniref:alpha/beta fold hydrolase n=1 Tax=Pigmentiphaga sp. TaxID=1977564 RepID=UPI0029A74709|nr:alpha/beta hydrolase [Pigmentiphaga sp.]MDX3905147.1 alpha/beta hydrolase [Pigmentiphaga sp.]
MAAPSFYGAHVRANGIRQHYLRFPGPGRDIVIVPGIVSPAALWQHVGEFLQAGFDVRILDVRGRGLSEQGSHLDYRVDACAADLEAFIASQALRAPIVIGHSMGARIAARLAARGGGIGELIMLDPPCSGPGKRPYPVPMDRTIKMLEACRRGEGDAYLRGANVAPWPEPLLRQRAEWLATCDPRAVHEAYLDFQEQDFHADVAGIACPVTLVPAQASGVILADELAALQAGQPALKVVVAEGAAHQMQAENIDTFFTLLRTMLPFKETEI